MLGLSLWEGRLPGQQTIENEDSGSHCSYTPESNFGTSDTVFEEGNYKRLGPAHIEVVSPQLQRLRPGSNRSARLND